MVLKFFFGCTAIVTGMFGFWVISNFGEKLEKEIPASFSLPLACGVLIIAGGFLLNRLFEKIQIKLNE